jgi:hypothetical protein
MARRQEETNLVRLLIMQGPIRKRSNRESRGSEKGRSQKSHDEVFSQESHLKDEIHGGLIYECWFELVLIF